MLRRSFLRSVVGLAVVGLVGVKRLSAKCLYSVKYYGAKGNGYHDDTTAIQRAIKEASRNGGGTIYFPPGEYNVRSIG